MAKMATIQPRGSAPYVSPLSNNNETHLLTDRRIAQQPTLLNIPEITPLKIFDANCTISVQK